MKIDVLFPAAVSRFHDLIGQDGANELFSKMGMPIVKGILQVVWKLPLSSLVFMIGLILSGIVLPQLGLKAPDLPEGADAQKVSLYFGAGSLLFGIALALLAGAIRGTFLTRWLSLSAMMWVAYAVNNVIEGAIFSTFSATSSPGMMLYTGLSLLPPSLAQAAIIAALFRPHRVDRVAGKTFADMNWTQRLWRLAAAWLAFPVIYYLFGLVVYPFVEDFYVLGQFDLVIPSLSELLPVQFLRSALFLVVSLPIVMLWVRSRASFVLRLGFALFIFVGGFSMLTSYWFAWELRLYHALEILADELVYALVLGLLFLPTGSPGDQTAKSSDPVAVH